MTERNINGFAVRTKKTYKPAGERETSLPKKVSIEGITFNLKYRLPDGVEVQGYRRPDTRRIILSTGHEVSHSWASRHLEYLGKISGINTATAKGSNARGWMKAYSALVQQRDAYFNMPAELITEELRSYIKGFDAATKFFEARSGVK